MRRDTTAAAKSASSLNGFTDGSNNVTVTVNNPPKSGLYSGNSSYVEVIVKQVESTYFMGVLGITTVPISARSVSSSVNGPACLYALDPSSSGALTVSGSSSATLSCGAMIDSDSGTGAVTNGGGSLTASNIGVVGGYSGSGFTPNPVTGIASSPDPLSGLAEPSVGSCTPGDTNVHVNKATTLQQGVYCGGIQISGSTKGSGFGVTFDPGTYILLGGLQVTGSATLTGTGVMFYNTYSAKYSYGQVSIAGSATVNLSAPTSGTYAGILFFQDRSVPTSSKGQHDHRRVGLDLRRRDLFPHHRGVLRGQQQRGRLHDHHWLRRVDYRQQRARRRLLVAGRQRSDQVNGAI